MFVKKIEMLIEMEQRYRPKEMGRLSKTITVVVMKSNYKSLAEIVDFAEKYNFQKVTFYPVMHMDGPENIFINMNNDIKTGLKDRMNTIKKMGVEYGIEIVDRLPDLSENKQDAAGG